MPISNLPTIHFSIVQSICPYVLMIVMLIHFGLRVINKLSPPRTVGTSKHDTARVSKVRHSGIYQLSCLKQHSTFGMAGRECVSCCDVSTRTMQIQLVRNTSRDACFPRLKASSRCFFVSRYCNILRVLCFTRLLVLENINDMIDCTHQPQVT